MGERACYTGICDACGKTPPCLRWMYPDGPTSSSSLSRRTGRTRPSSVTEGTQSGSTRSGLHPRDTWHRSGSMDRQVRQEEHTRQGSDRRRASISSSLPSIGVSPARIDLSSF